MNKLKSYLTRFSLPYTRPAPLGPAPLGPAPSPLVRQNATSNLGIKPRFDEESIKDNDIYLKICSKSFKMV